MAPARRILFATSEAFPLSKTGGLGDVCGSLPAALHALGTDARVVLPAYRHALGRTSSARPVGAPFAVPGVEEPVRLLETALPGDVPVWLVDAPALYDRPGTPYHDPDGREHPDNALRFAALSRAVVAVAQGRAGLDWRPDLVHAHDWTVGLVPALLAREQPRPATVFTIHNLAHQGLFPAEALGALELPPAWWSLHALEFYGKLSFIKGGLVYADWLTTVSPSYAREICRPEQGFGLDGLLRHRRDRLVGILNGADYGVWDPRRDDLIARCYGPDTFEDKAYNKRALQRLFGFADEPRTPLLAFVARLVGQKGVDLLTDAMPALLARRVQVVVLGRGEQQFEAALLALASRHPGQLAVYAGYSEELAHRMTAGADAFLMPSRFEPCGLNQIYALRYGTVPIVRRTGGLADTVVDATEGNLATGEATGFHLGPPTVEALLGAVDRALALYRGDPAGWRRLALNGMDQDFSWERGARAYDDLYRGILTPQPPPPRPASARLRRVPQASGGQEPVGPRAPIAARV